MVKNNEKKVLEPKSMTDLVKILTSYSIPVERYGIGSTLPLQALLEQVEEKRSILYERDGVLIRDMSIVAINVYHHSGKTLLKLHEDRQVRLDHESANEIKEKKSRRRIDWSVAKKVAPGSDLLERAVMTLKHELGLSINPDRLVRSGYKVTYNRSNKFPKLKNHMRVHEYDLFLRKEEFEPEGYSYKDKYLKSYFYWKGVE